MAKFIDLEKIKPIDFPSTEMDGLDVVRYLNTLPTVDAVEVVHGRWIAVGGNHHTRISQCTNCCAKYDFRSKYCPHCGAKMDGVSDG